MPSIYYPHFYTTTFDLLKTKIVDNATNNSFDANECQINNNTGSRSSLSESLYLETIKKNPLINGNSTQKICDANPIKRRMECKVLANFGFLR